MKKLRKIILVCGVGNSGKTSSIKRFVLENNFEYKKNNDFIVSLKIKRSAIGIASGGDNLDILQRIFNFFGEGHLDFIVCASKAKGQTFDFIKTKSEEMGAKLVPIHTTKEESKKLQELDHKKVADEIWANIRAN
jgi:GTPase SAR1 family protein